MSYLINLTKREGPLHKHKHYEMIVYTKGDGLFHCEEKDIPVCPGKIVIVPPETMHSTPFGNDMERIYINGEFHQFFSLTSPTLILDNSENEGMSLAKMIYANRYSNSEYLSALCNAFAYFLLQRLKIDNEMHLIIEDMMNKMAVNFYDCNININDLLRKSGYAEDCKSLYIGSIPVSASKILFRDSSAVEQSAVNRLVVGSNPTRGANMKTRLKRRVFF